MARAGARTLARQLVDVLPHPLYALVAVLERFGPSGAPIEIDWVRGGRPISMRFSAPETSSAACR